MCGSLVAMAMTRQLITLADGRTLDVFLAGADDAPLVVNLPGTPQGHRLLPALEEAAELTGVRIASIARPGYAGSTRLPGRSVADVVPDVLEVVDALGVARFAVVGTSGGGPHALACGALAGDRCVAVAVVSGVGPWDTTGLDFLHGMGEGNEVEFGAALRGENPLRELLALWREEILSAGAWGFDLAGLGVPVFLWQGEQDLMVPPAHGRWLADAVPNCRARLLPDDGHLTVLLNRPAEILADLAAAFRIQG